VTSAGGFIFIQYVFGQPLKGTKTALIFSPVRWESSISAAAAMLTSKKHLPLCFRYKKHLLNEDKKTLNTLIPFIYEWSKAFSVKRRNE